MSARLGFAVPLSILLFAAPLLAASSPSPYPAPSSAASLFKPIPMGALPKPTATEAPRPIVVEEEAKPIPTSWKIGGIALGVVALLALLYGGTRAWRSSNLFDRQYRFPTGAPANLRLGGMRSGGQMATIRFSPAAIESETKDA